MLSLTIAGGIFLLDYKIKEHIDSTRLQGSKEEVLGGRLLLRNCHNKDKILGKAVFRYWPITEMKTIK